MLLVVEKGIRGGEYVILFIDTLKLIKNTLKIMINIKIKIKINL